MQVSSCRELSSELADKEMEVQELLSRVAGLEEEKAILWSEAQQGLSLAASLADMDQLLRVDYCKAQPKNTHPGRSDIIKQLPAGFSCRLSTRFFSFPHPSFLSKLLGNDVLHD